MYLNSHLALKFFTVQLEIFTRRIRSFSPLALLGLAACVDGETGDDLSSGFALKGPLANALVFADENGNNILDAGEENTRTGSDGGYSLSNANGATIVVITDSTTTDATTGEILDGLTMTAPADSGVITPMTSLLSSGIDAVALAAALGLEGVDLLTYNPFAEDVDPDLPCKQSRSHRNWWRPRR